MIIDGASALVLKELLNAKGPISSAKIAVNIGISSSSVKSFVKNLKEVIELNGGELIGKPNVGYEIKGSDDFKKKMNYLLINNVDSSYSFKERMKYILSILFSAIPDYTIQLLADDLYIGKNRVLKDLDLIDEWLIPFHVNIKRLRKYGLSLSGNESDIREAMIEYNRIVPLKTNLNKKTLKRPKKLDERFSVRYFYATKEIYEIHDFFQLQTYLLEVEEDIGKRFTNSSIRKLIDYLLVSKNRALRGQLINRSEFNYDYNRLEKFLIPAEKLLRSIHFPVNKNFKFEVERLAIIFSCLAYQGNANNTFKTIRASHYFLDLANKITNDVSSLTRTNFKDKPKLIERLGSLLESLYFKHKYHIVLNANMQKDVKKSCPDIYAACITSISTINEAFTKDLTDGDIAEMTMLFYAFTPETKVLNAVFVTTNDYFSANFCAKELDKKCERIHIGSRWSLEDWKKIGKPCGDILLSDIHIDVPEGAKYLFIHLDSIDEAVNYINEYLKENNDSYQEEMTEKSSFHKLLSPKLIEVNSNIRNKEELIERGIDILKKYEYVDSVQLDVILQKEKKAPTTLGNEVAIPCINQESIMKSGLSFIQLRKPLQWTPTERVSLVFFLALKMEDVSNIKKFSSKLYTLLKDENALNELKNAKSSNEAYKLLLNYLN